MTPENRKHLAAVLLAVLATVIASCSWLRQPDVQNAKDAVLSHGDEICFMVPDEAGDRRVCASAVELVRAADALAEAIEARAAASTEAAAVATPPHSPSVTPATEVGPPSSAAPVAPDGGVP